VTARETYPDLGLHYVREYVDHIAVVSRGHRLKCRELKQREYDSVPFADNEIRLRFLACLLNVADELDIDFRRVNLQRLKTENLTLENKLHWFKHYYVNGVEIKNGNITVCFVVPDVENDYAKPVQVLVLNKILEVYDDLKELLWGEGVYLKISEDPILCRSKIKEPMPPELYSFMVQKVATLNPEFEIRRRALSLLDATRTALEPEKSSAQGLTL